MKHKHCELIKAWAEGSEIEIWIDSGKWCLCHDPLWNENYVYRVKPEKVEVPVETLVDRFIALYNIEEQLRSYIKEILEEK